MEGNGVLTVTIKPVDFRKAKGFAHSNFGSMDCPLANALKREGYNPTHVGRDEVELDGIKIYKIPTNIWGKANMGPDGIFSPDRINKLSERAKWRIPFTVPSVTLVLEATN